MSAPEWKLRTVEVAGSLVLTLLGTSLRFQVEGDETVRELKRDGTPVIYAFWHSDLLPLAHLHRHQGVVILVSEHRDGEYIARVIERRGFGTVRGSSTRGGAKGLRGMLKAARTGHDLGITPDGPRGPPRRVKAGAIVAARLTGLPLVPTAVAGARGWRLDSWDRFLVPAPLSRVIVRYGSPIRVPRDADAATLESRRLELERAINDLDRDPP